MAVAERELAARPRRDGTLAGVALIRAARRTLDRDGYVHPDAFGAARHGDRRMDRGARPSARLCGDADRDAGAGRAAACLCGAAASSRSGSFYRMVIELDEPPPRAGWPEGYVVATLRARRGGDPPRGPQEAFARPLGPQPRTFDEWQATHEARATTSVFLVRAGDEVAAAACATHRRFGLGWVDILGTSREHWRGRGLGEALLARPSASSTAAARAASPSASTPGTRPARPGSTRASACASPGRTDVYEEAVGRLRACRASARSAPTARRSPRSRMGPDYQCHSCGAEFGAGLVRVPRAWGKGGEAMAEAAALELAVPGGGGRRRGHARGPDPRARLRASRAAARPRRLLLLARRRGRGPGGAARPPRGRLDRRARRPEHARELAVGQRVGHAAADDRRLRRRPSRPTLPWSAARDLDPPEREFIEEAGIHTGKHAVERALGEVDCVYVAVDFDGLDEDEVAAFMPVPGGIRLAEASRRSCARSPRTRPCSAPASPASSPTRRTSSPRRA